MASSLAGAPASRMASRSSSRPPAATTAAAAAAAAAVPAPAGVAPAVVQRRQQQQLQQQQPPRWQQQRRGQQQLVRSSKLEDVPLFADNGLVGSKPSGAAATTTSGAKAGGAAGPAKLEDIPLTSELGLDYSDLRGYLAAGDVRKADDETRALLIRMAGPGAVQRGWVYFTEVAPIPEADLRTVDALWRAASGGRFGYSVQREMWVQAARRWPKFFKAIDWTVGDNNVYRKWPAEFVYAFDAPKGHMPLTNALRGTQLFQAIMEHPAFSSGKAGGSGGGAAMSIDERSKSAAKDTLKF